MSKVRYSSKLDSDLLNNAKEFASDNGFEGANEVIEEALRLYFANCNSEVWEKHFAGGWVKKMVIRPSRVTVESVRSRKALRYSPQQYTAEVLSGKGWRQVWKLRKPDKATS